MHETPTDTPRCAHHSRVISALIAACRLAAGCGSSTPSHGASSNTGASSNPAAAQTAFSKCMRTNGVPDFPDQDTSISGPYVTMAGIEVPTTID